MGKPSFKLRPLSSPALRRFYGLAAGALAPGLALAAPSGGAVVGGQASIGSPGAGNTVINQTSQNAIINWQQFSVGGNEFVLFNQPSASAAVLNRVVGGLPSEILGNISANGRVFIVNPQGVMFGAGSRVDVGGLVTSTLNIRDQDFMSGRHVFAQGESAPGSIRNEGRISAGPGGFVVLAADRVENAGLISAPNGEVLLAAASKMTLTLDAEGLVGYSIDAAALSDRAGIENIGEIVASGGTVVLDAKVARSLMGNVINQRGRISARSVEERDGVIYLSAEGGDIENSGTLDASGTGNADGGRVVVHSDQDVRLTETGVVRADGAGTGNGGMIRLVAEQQLETAEGSVVSATAGPAGQLGGFVELSGHGGLKIRGQVDVGRRGQVLIDPLLLTIADGSGGSVGSTSSGTSATVYEQTIEGLLQSGADVALIADNRITLATLSDGTLDGRNANGTGGGLLLGIGTISEPTTNGVFVDGPPAVGYTFNPGPGGSSYGGIFFQTLGNAIRVDGRLRVSAGYSLGNIRVGDLEGNDIDVSGAGDIELGDVTLSGTGGSVVISNAGSSGSSQDIVIGSLAAAGASLVDIDARNNVQILGNLQADAALVEISSGFDGSGQISASGISGDQVRLQSSGGDISIGGVISANGGLRSGGDIDVDAAGGSVTLNGVSLDGRGQADISASNNARLLGSYDLGADDGELRVYADSVILGAALPAVGIGVTGGLDITADEVTAYGAAGDDAINATGDVSITAGTVEFTGNLTAGGEVNIDVDADVLSLQDVRGSRVRLAAAGFDITVGTISAAGGGSAGLLDVEVSGTETSRVQVGGIDLDTDGYALVSGASGIDGLDSASFTVGEDGTLELRTLSSLDLGSVFGVDGRLVGSGASVTGNVVDVGGDLTLTATGSVDLNAAVTAGGLATIMAGDSSSLSLASLEADGIVLYGGNNTSVSAGTLTANGGFRSSGDINVDAYGSYGGVAIGSIQLNGPGRVDVTGAAGVALRDGADVGAGGSLNLRADGGVLQFGSSASSPMSIVGNLYGTANNGARIEAYQDIAVSSGDATLNANGSGASISLFGVLGAEDGRIEIDATGPISIAGLAAGSSIQVDATGSSGSISLGAIGLAAPGDVRVAGTNGVTLLGDIDAGIGGLIYVSASGGALTVGSDGAPAGSTMAFTGNLALETTSSADVRAWQDIEVTGGDLVIDADADLGVASLTASNGGVRLTAGGDISTGGITADGGFAYSDGVRVVAEGADPLMNLGSITLLNEGAVYLSGASGVAITQTIDAGGPNGTIEVQASGGILSLGTASDAVDFVGNLAAYADYGAGIRANIGAAQDVELQVRTDGVSIGGLEAVSIIADGKITLGNTYGGTAVRGDIVIGTLDAGGNVYVTSSRDVDASGTITAVGLVDIEAGTGIGGTGVATLGDVSGNRVSIEADGGVSTGLLTAVGISSGSGDFNVYVASAETVSVSGITLTGGNTGRAYLQGDNGITLDGTNFSLGSDGTLKLSAATSGLDFGTNFSLTGNLEANAGEIDGGALTVTGDLTLKSPGDIDLTGFVDAGGRLEIDGQGGAGVINLQGAYGDRVYIVNDGDITIGGTLSAGDGGSASSHDVDVLANGGTLDIGGLSVADGHAYLSGDDVNLSPTGSFAVGYGGELEIDAVDQISFGTGVSDQLSIIGSVNATAQNIVGNRILTSHGLSLSVGAQLDINATGLLRADSGDIVISGDSDGAIVGIGDAVANRISITNRGAISTGALTADGGGSAASRDIHIQALSGGTGPATISVGTIGLANMPAEGYVELYAQDGVVLLAGANVGAGGTLKITNEQGVVDLGDVAQGGSLDVVNYGGDIQGGELTADSVTLYNLGGATTANVEFDSITAADDVTIDARDGITANGDIVSTGGVIDLAAGGAVSLQDASGNRVIVFTPGSISTGTLSASGSGTSAGNADVKIESTAGSVDVTGIDLAGAGYAYLLGSTGIDITGTSFDVGGGTLQLQTGGQLNFGDDALDSFELEGNLYASVGSVVGTSVTTLGGGYIDLDVSGTVDVGELASASYLRVVADGGIVTGGLLAVSSVELESSGDVTVGGTINGSGVTIQGDGIDLNGAVNAGVGNVDIDGATIETLALSGAQVFADATGSLNVVGGITASFGISIGGGAGTTVSGLIDGGTGYVDIGAISGATGVIDLDDVKGGGIRIGDMFGGTASSITTLDLAASGNLEVSSTSGDIDIGSISLIGGDGSIVSGAALSLGGDVTAAGNLTISAATGDLVLQSLEATAGYLAVDATAGALSLVDATAGGALTLDAAGDLTASGDLEGATVVALSDGLVDIGGTVTADGRIELSAVTGVSVDGQISGANAVSDFVDVHTQAGQIDLAGVSAANGTVRIGDMFGGAAAGISTGALSGTGIELRADGATADITVSGTVGADGDAAMSAGGNLAISGAVNAGGLVDLDGQAIDTQSLSGNKVLVDASGPLTVVGTVSASNGISLQGSGVSVSGLVDGDAGYVDIGTTGSGAILLASVSGGGLRIGDGVFGGSASSITVSGSLASTGDVEVVGSVADIDIASFATVSGDIKVESGGTLAIGGDIISTSGGLSLKAGQGSLDLGDVDVAGSADITVQDGALDIDSLSAGSATLQTIDNGSITTGVLTTISGDLYVDAVLGQSAATSSSVTISGVIQSAGLVSLTAGPAPGASITATDITAGTSINLGNASVEPTVAINVGDLTAGTTVFAKTDGASLQVGRVEAGGDIGLYAFNDTLTVGGDVISTGGAVTLQADTDLVLAGLTAGGGALYVQADNGSVSTEAVSASGSIFIQSGTGDVTADSLDGDGGITVNATNGQLTVNGAVTGSGGSIALNGGDGVSVSGTLSGADDAVESINVRSGGLVELQDVTATGGSVDIESSGDNLSAGAVSGVSGIRLSAAGTLVYSGNLTAGNGGVAVYAGAGDLLLSDLTAGGGAVDVQADNGLVTVDDVSASASIRLQSGTGNVTAASLDGDGGVIVNAYSGDIAVTGAVTADGGGIELNSGGSLTVGGDVSGANDSFEVIKIRSAGAVDLQNVTASGGSVDIESSGDDVSVLAVSGPSGIRLSAAGTLSYSGNLTASNGGVAIYAGAGDLLLSDLTAGGGAVDVQADNGSVTVEDVSASASIRLQSGTGNVTATSLDGDGGVIVNAYNGDVAVTGPVTADGGSISLNSGGSLTVGGDLNGADDAFEAITIRSAGLVDLQNVTASGGSVDIESSGDDVSVLAVSGPSGIRLSAAGTLGYSGNLTASNGGITLYAGAGDLLLADLTAGGAVTVQADNGSVTVEDVSAGAAIQLQSGTGDVTTASLDGDGGITVNAYAGQLVVNGAVTASGGSIALNGGNGVEVSGNISGADDAFESIGIRSGNGAVELQDVTATGGSIVIDNSLGGMAAPVAVGAVTAAGNVDIASMDDVTLSGAVSGAVVNITAATLDSATAVDVSATGRQVYIDADIQAPVIDIGAASSVTVTGSIDAGTAGSVTLVANNGDVSTGAITTSDLTVTANTIDFGDLDLTGDLSLTSNVGDITTGALTAAGIMLDSAADIALGGAVSGDSIFMSADDISGVIDMTAAVGNLELDASTVTAGSIDLSGRDGITVSGQLQAAVGSVSLLASNGLLQVGGITAANLDATALSIDVSDLFGVADASLSGDVSLAATAGDILGGNLMAGGSMTLLASDAIDAGTISASGDVSATAATGDITVATVTGANVTLTAVTGTLDSGAITASSALVADTQDIILRGAVTAASVDLQAANQLAATGLLDVTAMAGTLRLEAASLGGSGADLSATGAATLVGNLGAGTGAVSIVGNGITADDISGASLLLTGGAGMVDTDKLTATAGAITATGGSIDAGTVSATGDVTATASSGALKTSTIGGSVITLTANSGALTTGAITGAGAVTADAQSISLGGAVQGSSVDLDAVNTLSASGLLDVTATAGALRLEGSSLGGNGADLSATGLVTLVGNLGAGSSSVTISGSGIVADDISGSSLLLAGGTSLVDTVNLTATAGAITVTGGSIDTGTVAATGDVTATASGGALKTSTVGGSVITLTANSGALTTGAITGTGAVTADAQSISLGGAVQGASVDLDAANALAATGLLDVTATAGTLRLEGASLGANGADLLATGTVTLVGDLGAGTGAVSIVGSGITADDISGSNLLLAGGAGLVDTDNLTATAGAITATGGSIDAGLVFATGNVTATASSGALKTSTIDGGAITLTANSGALTTGPITGAGAVTADAQSISLGGAVQGSSVDLDAANALAATGLLDVTATAGTLRLEGSSLGGSGADLSATGGVTLVGNLAAGTGTVSIVGSGITADDISGGSLLLTGGTGLVDAGSLTATAGAITVTGGSIDAGVVSGMGNVTATASSGALKTSTIDGDVITLTANSGALTTGAVTGVGAVTADAQSISLGGALQGSSVDLVAANVLAATGLLDVTATAGALRLEGASLGGNGADLSATGAVTLVGNLGAGTGAVVISSNGITANDISGSSLLLTGGTGVVDTDDLTATADAITVTGGIIDAGVISATGNVTATASNGALKTSTVGGSAITLTANGGALTAGAITGTAAVVLGGNGIVAADISGSSLQLTGGAGLVDSDDLTATAGAITATGGSIDAGMVSASGNVTATASSGALKTSTIVGSTITLTANSGALTTGAITGTGAVTADAQSISLGGAVQGSSVDLDAVNSLAAIGLLDVTATAGSLRLEGGSLGGGGADLSATGTVTLVGNLGAGSGAASIVGGGITADDVSGSSLLLTGGTGVVDAGSLTATAGAITVTGGSIDAGVMSATGNVTATASSGALKTSTVGGSTIALAANGGALTAGAITGTAAVTLNGNGITADDIGGSSLLLTGGTGLVDTGKLTASAGAITVSGGSIDAGVVSATGNVTATASTGALKTSTIGGSAITLTASSGALSTDEITGTGAVTADAQSISLGGAVRGTSVDLDAANALAATGLLDVTAATGTLRLEGASLGGAGADLSASGALILVGDLAGGSALVDLSGDTINAEAISGGTVKLAATGLLTAGNITAGAGGITATALGLDTGDLTATGGGDITATATAGDLLAGAVSGDVVTLLASGGIETAGIVANTLSLTAGGSLTTLNLQAGSGGASLSAASIDAGSITVVGGDLSATAQSGDLEADDILASDVELTAEQGDIAVGDVTASEASFSAPEGAITVGSVDSAGDVDFDFGTGLDTGALTLAGTLFADLDNTDAVFGDVNAQAVDITVSGGDIVIGNVTVTQDIDLTASGRVQFGNLNGQDIAISLGQDSTIGSSQVIASGSFALDGAGVLGGNALTVQAQGIDVGAGLALESASFTTPGSASFSGALFEVQTLTVTAASIGIDNATLEAGEATLNSGGNVTLANAQLTGGRYTVSAAGLVQDAGEGGSLFDVAALGISASEIALGDSIIQVGNGVAAIGGDAGLLAALQGKNPDLLPASPGPNASFIASRVELGSLELAGDYLYISADDVQFAGSIEAPVDLFVHFSPMTASADLGIETAAAMARQINLNRDEHFNVFPGTTFAIGGIGFGGDIFVGENGPVTLSPRQSNFVFMTEGSIFGLSNLATNGSVVVLGGTAVSYNEIEVPLNDEFKPDLPGDELKIDSTEDKASGFAAGEVEYESAPEEGDDSLQCT